MRHRIILEYNDEAGQWEWEIQRWNHQPGTPDHWEDIPGDYFAGQNSFLVEAVFFAKQAWELACGTQHS